MANILDNKEQIAILDSKKMLASIGLLGKQVEQVFKQAKSVKIPGNYSKVNKILVLGMGGSALGSHLIKSVFAKELKLPLDIVNGYEPMGFVDGKTLVVCSSYSGNTEEVLAAAGKAKNSKAKILAICAGGKLADWAKKNKLPALVFTTENNPCGSPRMGLGYSVFGQIAVFSKLGLLKFSPAEAKKAADVVERHNLAFGAGVNSEDNPAKQLAAALAGKSAWHVASEHLAGNAHIAANQMNENAKRFAGYFVIPELNHHLMEGMLYPESNKQNLAFLLIESGLYNERVQKRYEITKQVLDKNGISHVSYKCREKSRLLQACEMLALSSHVSFYSAILQGIDPAAIPFVDFFKEQLKH